MEQLQKEIARKFQLAAIFIVLGVAIMVISIVFLIKCAFNPIYIGGLLVGLGLIILGILNLENGLKKVRKLKDDAVKRFIQLSADHQCEIQKINGEHKKEIEAIEEQNERDRFKIVDPSENQKRTYVVPVLADISGGIYAGLLHTDVPAEVMGKALDFYGLVEGNPDPSMIISGLPMNPGGEAGKKSGLSIRTGLLISGQAHSTNSVVLNGKDENVVVVMIYNAEVTGVSGHSLHITQDVSGFSLKPLDHDLLRCEFVALDVLKPKVNTSLARQIIAELPEWLKTNMQ